ncbi:hypothetical protein CKM354_000188100 [Cercospora kikuchii]|uniref:SRPBCC family protein n=1 Tax=Cercospora kikuchii TaxID=84275 RepID=A0A9P3C8Q9_9PEZI|nr:uncharacterized protein CKM354_000188100 [Cercospora kikuchii]GIZ38464.1 hypothetical protein CKM354_000188100 [Cercospora kikuchii]
MGPPANDYASREGLVQVCEVTSTIEQPVEAVWGLMSALERLTEWMPGMESCTVPEDTPPFPEYGAVRVVKLKGSEASYHETLEIFDAENHFTSYVANTEDSSPVNGSRGSTKMESLTETSTRVTWRLDLKELPSPEIVSQLQDWLVPFIRESHDEARKVLLKR